MDERINGTVKKELRLRRREERNGGGAGYWGRGTQVCSSLCCSQNNFHVQGTRERKCFTVESAESRSEREEGSEPCA